MLERKGNASASAGLEALHTWQAHTLPVTGIATGAGTASQLVVSVSLDRTAVVWTLDGGGVRLRTLLFPAALTCCTLDTCDWALYAGSMDGRIFTAPLAGGDDSSAPSGGDSAATSSAQQLVGHTRPVRCIVPTADGAHLVSCGDDGVAVVWCASSRQALRSLAHTTPPTCVTQVLLAPPTAATAMAAGAGHASRTALPLAPLAKYFIPAQLHGGSGAAKPWEGPLVALCGHRDQPVGPVLEGGSQHGRSAGEGAHTAGEAHHLAAQLQQAREEAARWKALHGQMRALVAEDQT